MVARTTSPLVAGIIEVDEGDDLDPFILSANELVTECCDVPAFNYSPERLELIERWLAAHFYAIKVPRAQEERAGPVWERIVSKADLGLDVTHYGQQAMRLDTKGGLAVLNNSIKKAELPMEAVKNKVHVGMVWLGERHRHRRPPCP